MGSDREGSFSSFCILPFYFTLQAVAAGRFSLITLRTALSAARRSAGSAARYWATVEAVMLAMIPAAVRGRELYGGRL